MHELGICRSLMDVAQAALDERGITRPVTRVCVEVGRYTSVVPDALAFAFEALRPGTLFERAELDITSIPLRVACAACGTSSEADDPWLLCARCGGPLAVLAGRELRMTAIDVAEEAA